MNNDNLNGFEELAVSSAPMPPALELDPAEYMADLEEFDLTEAQKIELLETLWSIMRSFAELGFRVNICEQFPEIAALDDFAAPEGVKSPRAKEADDE